MNPFSIVDAPAWLSLPEVSEDPTEYLEQLARLARLVDRLQEVAQYAPRLHETLPWLADLSVWDLILRLGAEGRFPKLSDGREFRDLSDPDLFPNGRGNERETVSPKRSGPSGHSTTAATLLSFFARVTQPVEQMIESLYVSPFLRDPISVWEILRRMARAAGAKALPQDVVIGVCASLVRRRVDEMGRDRARPRLATWKITWRPIPLKLRWPQPPRPLLSSQLLQGLQRSQRSQHPGFAQQSSRQQQQQQLLRRSCDPSGIEGIIKSFIVVVTEETVLNRAAGYEPSGKILAFRCIHGKPGYPGNPTSAGSADDQSNTDNNGNAGKPGTIPDPQTLSKAIETAVRLALFDALVFPLTFRGEFRRHISPPTLLRVQSPMRKAIQQAAHVWRIKVEEIEQHIKDSKDSKGGRHCQRCSEGKDGKDGPTAPQPCDCAQGREWDWGWEWEKELTNRVLDPVHYLRILDRAVERAYGYAPFQTKQKALHQLGWRWRMFPQDDPLLYYPGLREVIPSFPATVGEDGTVEWKGWHYRDHDEDLLRYFPKAQVTIRPSPLSEAAILVYWKSAILCYAVADELRHDDGSYRPYWFPYPRLGE
ncbi:MAG: hypothetical protein IVW55_09740 [Chloroflexi bacterium]|nr:hypothetical protein [Chloroflexota bacterium]